MNRTARLIILVILGVFLLMIISFYLTVTVSSPATVQISSTATTATRHIPLTDKTLQTIILSPTTVFCYTNNLNEGRTLSLSPENEYRDYLQELKKKWGDSLEVIIKTTSGSTNKSTIDVLDEMTINNIRRFAMEDPNEQEKKKISGEHL